MSTRREKWWREKLVPIEAELTRDEARNLLMQLCVTYGYCLPPQAWHELEVAPPIDCDAFTAAVFIGEGLPVPDTRATEYRSVRAVVASAFERHNAALDI